MQPVEIEFLVKNNTRSGLEGASKGIDGVEKDAVRAQKSVKALQAEIERLRETMAKAPEMDQTENIRQIDELKRRIAELQKASQTTDLVPRSAPAAVRTYNGLNMSIQQIARELPSLAMGPQMFFLAISNNLPIFTDELARARREYEAITAAGGKGIPVWRQLLSSIVSWQTALAVGIMLSVTYGREIGDFVSSLFRGKTAFDSAAKAAEGYHLTLFEGTKNAQKERVELDLLYKAATNNALAMDERRNAVSELQSMYPEYFGNMSKEQIMLGNAKDRYDELTAAIIRSAQAQAARDKIAENSRRILDVQQSREYKEYTAQSDFAKNSSIEDLMLRTQGNEEAAARLKFELKKNAEIQGRMLFDAYKEVNEEFAEEAESLGVTSFEEYINTLNALNERLAPDATKLYTDPLKGTRTNSKDTTQDDYGEVMRTRRQALDEQTVALMDEGFEKERAQIRLQYEKTRAEYEAEETKTLALIKKLRAAGAEVSPDAERDTRTMTTALVAGAAKLRDRDLAEVDRRERESYDKLLEKYETYQQGRLRIAEKYDKDIAALAASPENRRIAAEAKQKALDDFTLTFAGQFPEFEAWADMIAAMSIEKVEEALKDAQDALTMLRELHPYDEGAIAEAEAKVLAAKRRLAALRAGGETEETATDTVKWTELHDVLADVIDTFDEVGDAIGGAAGEIVAAAGRIASSTLQIVNAVNAVREAKSSNDGLGMASGILGGISAGVGVLTTLFSLFKGGETSLEKNLRLARELNEELALMRQNARIDSDSFDNIFGDRLYSRFRQNADVVREALEQLKQTRESLASRGNEVYDPFSKGSTGLAGLDKVSKTWESTAESVAAMQVQTRHSTWFRSAKYASLGDLLPELFEDGEIDMAALQKFVEEGGETFQHLSDENKRMLQQMVDDWSLYTDALDSVRDYLRDIFGELGDSMTDALVSAAENGTDAFDAMAEDVGQTLRKLAKSMITSTILGPIIEEAQKRMEEITTSDMSDEERFAAYAETLKKMMGDALQQQGTVADLWEEIKKYAAEQGIDIGDTEGTTQSGRAGAVQAVTQESFSELLGLATSMQIHLANMDSSMTEGIVPTLGGALDAINKIEAHCRTIPSIYAIMSEWQRDGLKVK